MGNTLMSMNIHLGNRLVAQTTHCAMGLEFLRSFSQTEAIPMDSDMQVYVTQGLRYRFQAEKGIEVTVFD